MGGSGETNWETMPVVEERDDGSQTKVIVLTMERRGQN